MSITRATLAALLADNRNGWIHTFALASSKISAAIAEGKISQEQVEAYEGDPTSESAQSLAKAAGLGWLATDGPAYVRGWTTSVDEEDVRIAVEALRGLLDADVDDDSATWSFPYPETLQAHNATIDDIEVAMGDLTDLRDAARLIVEADRAPLTH